MFKKIKKKLFEEINRFFDDLPRILLDELRNNSLVLNRMDYDEIIAGIYYLSSIICNKQITHNDDLNVPDIPKKRAREILKEFLEYIDAETIDFFLEKNILLSETSYNPINTIAFYDKDQTIRAVNLPDDLLELVWSNLPLTAKKIKE